MQEKTLMHVFRTRICTKHYQALLSDMEQICDTKSLFHSTKEHQRCSAGYLFNNTSFTLRCESQGKYITHDFAGQQRTKHTIWSTKSSLGCTARTNTPELNNLHLRRTQTQSVPGLWFLPLLEQGHRLKLRLDSTRQQAQHWHVKAESFTSLPTAIAWITSYLRE